MKKVSSLSPRFQISIRNLLRIKKDENTDFKLETWKQMDQFVQDCQQEQQSAGLNTSRTSIKQEQLNATYIEYFNKKQKEMKQEAFTTIIKSCSEYFINTLYIALVGDAVNDKLDRIGTISQVLLSFGIQPGSLKNMDENEKRDYIIQKFNITIDNLMQRWKERVESRQQQTTITHVETKIKPQPLKWLNIKTRYQSLKGQLAQVLYRKLDELSELESMVKKQSTIYLNDVTRPTILELIKRMDPTIGKLFQSLKSQKKIAVTSNKKIETTQTQSKKLYFSWNDELEMAFQENRQSSKTKYSTKISTCNFNVMGYLPLIQALNRRQSKFDENDGEIAYEEIKFAKAFSKFLARCADKKKLQGAVDLIDSDQISALEGNLAEHIIETHSHIVKIVQETRLKFLQSQTYNCKLNRNLREQSLQRQAETDRKRQELTIRKKRYQRIFKRNCCYNFYVFYFAKCVMKKIRQIRKRKTKPQPKFNMIVKKTARSSKSPQMRERCITEISTGPIIFRPSKITNKVKAVLKIQALIRRFLAQRFYKKVLRNRLSKINKTYRKMISGRFQS